MYEDNPSTEDKAVLSRGIADYALLMKQQAPIMTFAFFVRDTPDNQILGGCEGSTYYGCLYIDQLWLETPLRKQGLGRQLMQAAEQLGKKKDVCLQRSIQWIGRPYRCRLFISIR